MSNNLVCSTTFVNRSFLKAQKTLVSRQTADSGLHTNQMSDRMADATKYPLLLHSTNLSLPGPSP